MTVVKLSCPERNFAQIQPPMGEKHPPGGSEIADVSWCDPNWTLTQSLPLLDFLPAKALSVCVMRGGSEAGGKLLGLLETTPRKPERHQVLQAAHDQMWHWWHEETPFETTKYPSRLSPCQGYWSVFGEPLFSILPGPKLLLTLELRNGLVSYLGWPCLCWILGESPQIWGFLILFPNYQWPSTTHTSPWHPRALPIKASEGPQDLKVLVGWFPWKLTWIDYLTNLY